MITASLGKGLFKLKELGGDKVSCVLHEDVAFLNIPL